ncbi:MAG: acyltransferase family protein [Dehalococcoidia bacterium]
MSDSIVNTKLSTGDGMAHVRYIDWLRVLSMLSIFLFHTARFFDIFSDWHVKNSSTWIGGSIIVGFVSQWIMPLFFILAGAGTYYSLKARTAGRFIGERSLRLLIPFVFGVVVIVAPQAYYELLFRGHLSGVNFLQFYPQYLASLPGRFLGWDFYHLWFLAFLFIFSIVCLPLFLVLPGKRSSGIGGLASVIDTPWKLMLLVVIPVAAVDIFLYPGAFWGNRDFGGWNIVVYFLFYLSGYLLFANQKMIELLRRLRWFTSIAVIIASLALIYFINALVDWQTNYGSIVYIAAQAIQALNTWCLLVIIINLGRRYLDFTNRFLSYANEAVLPFYILHQTVIISIGFYVVQWNMDPALKYLIIALASFTLIMAIYDLLVRRVNVLRFLFGMRPAKK